MVTEKLKDEGRNALFEGGLGGFALDLVSWWIGLGLVCSSL